MADAEKSPQKTESMCALLDVTARIRHVLILCDVHPCNADARARDDRYCFKKSSLASTCERGFGLLQCHTTGTVSQLTVSIVLRVKVGALTALIHR